MNSRAPGKKPPPRSTGGKAAQQTQLRSNQANEKPTAQKGAQGVRSTVNNPKKQQNTTLISPPQVISAKDNQKPSKKRVELTDNYDEIKVIRKRFTPNAQVFESEYNQGNRHTRGDPKPATIKKSLHDKPTHQPLSGNDFHPNPQQRMPPKPMVQNDVSKPRRVLTKEPPNSDDRQNAPHGNVPVLTLTAHVDIGPSRPQPVKSTHGGKALQMRQSQIPPKTITAKIPPKQDNGPAKFTSKQIEPAKPLKKGNQPHQMPARQPARLGRNPSPPMAKQIKPEVLLFDKPVHEPKPATAFKPPPVQKEQPQKSASPRQSRVPISKQSQPPKEPLKVVPSPRTEQPAQTKPKAKATPDAPTKPSRPMNSTLRPPVKIEAPLAEYESSSSSDPKPAISPPPKRNTVRMSYDPPKPEEVKPEPPPRVRVSFNLAGVQPRIPFRIPKLDDTVLEDTHEEEEFHEPVDFSKAIRFPKNYLSAALESFQNEEPLEEDAAEEEDSPPHERSSPIKPRSSSSSGSLDEFLNVEAAFRKQIGQ